MSSAILLTGCFGDSRPEKERFIDATAEVTCLVFSSADLLDPQLEQQTKDIFESYGFDVENEEEMLEVAQRYDDDVDVQAAVEGALEECAGDLLEAFNNLSENAGEIPTGIELGEEAEEAEEGVEVPMGALGEGEGEASEEVSAEEVEEEAAEAVVL